MSPGSLLFEVICLVTSKLAWDKLQSTVPLDSLPFEVICLIASNLPLCEDKLSLVLCNRMLHDAAIHVLYKQDRSTQAHVLQWMVERGFEQGIQRIISRNNLDMNLPVGPWLSSINTPLLIAVISGRTNIVELFLHNGALVNLETDISALEYAATLGDYNITSLLLQHGAHVDLVGARCDLTPLGCAMEFGYPLREYNQHLLYWQSRNDRSKHGGQNEYIAVIQVLLAHGADPDFQSDRAFQFTCLHRIPKSPWESTEKVFGLFLDSGADVNAQNSKGDTPSTLPSPGMHFQEILRSERNLCDCS
ncbi:hypothetical protein N7463_002849 [Penicillium fimorum]|uniref:F-box domain-containing protein n=1 Tax=Penicillium fimorum TaxID=1882269 RepID=A0A9W9XZY5_9EURO|nr:hypothetical protein N7463_002849 [Penicillium fimorum]